MKKPALIAVGVGVLAVLGWSALWYAGRGELDGQLGAAVERLRAEGYEVDYTERHIGGFPFGYEVAYDSVRLVDPLRGMRYELPTVTGHADATAPGRVTLTFPDKFTVATAYPESLRQQRDDLPDELVVEVEADGLTVQTSGVGEAATTLEAAARSLMIVSAGESQPVAVAVELTGFEGALTVPNEPGVGRTGVRAGLERLDYAVSMLDPRGMRTTTEGIIDSVALSGSSDLTTRADWEGFAAGQRDGSAAFTYQAGKTVAQVKVDGNPDGQDGTVRQTAGTSGGSLSIGDGGIELRASSETNSFELEPAEADVPYRGAVRLDSLELAYVAPVVPAEQMSDFNVRLAATGLDIDESLWTLLDPGKTLDHGTAHLVFEISGTGRMLPLAEGKAPVTGSDAIELGRVTIDAASLTALGASVDAEGGVEFAEPSRRPQGTVSIRLVNALDTLSQLQALGLIDEGTFQTATLMSAIYTQPGATEDELVSEIDFSPDGITVNGLPVN